MSVKRVSRIAAMAVLLTACTSARIEERPPIRVPAGLTQPQIELAILAATSGKPVSPKAYDHTYFVGVGSIFETLLWQNYISSPAPRGWFPESHENGIIFAGFANRNYFLEIGIHYDTQAIRTEIGSSRNLDQTAKSIHKSAPVWIGQLEDRIRLELGKFAFSGSAASPAAPSGSP